MKKSFLKRIEQNFRTLDLSAHLFLISNRNLWKIDYFFKG